VAVLLLFPRGDPVFVTVARMEVLLNVALMVPLALLGRVLRPAYSWRDWTAVGFVLAVGVELVQGECCFPGGRQVRWTWSRTPQGWPGVR